MTLSAIVRFKGFSPREVTNLTNKAVVRQHADDGAFLWEARRKAVRSPKFSLRDLARLDERVEAQVDGLRLAGSAGWDECLSSLGDGPGTVFMAGCQALSAAHATHDWLDQVVAVGAPAPELTDGLVSACGWSPWSVTGPLAVSWLTSSDPNIQFVGVAAHAVHRIPIPSLALARLASSPDQRLREKTFSAAGLLRQRDLSHEIERALTQSAGRSRFLAARALLLLERKRADVITCLQAVAASQGPDALDAARIVTGRLSEESAAVWVRELLAKDVTRPAGLAAAGVAGYAMLVDDLLSWMRDEAWAKEAAGAFTMLTGVDIEYEDLDRAAPDSETEDSPSEGVPIGREASSDDLPLADPVLVAKKWGEIRSQYRSGRRYLAGRLIDRAGLTATLAQGRQPQRWMAAFELALLDPTAPVYPIDKRGKDQARELLSWP